MFFNPTLNNNLSLKYETPKATSGFDCVSLPPTLKGSEESTNINEPKSRVVLLKDVYKLKLIN